MFTIPTRTDVYFWTQTTSIEGTDYVLSFRYNVRESVYYMQISDTAGNVLLGGVKLISNFPLLRSVVDPALPPGELYALAPGADDSPAAFGELSETGRVTLVYQTEAELVASGQEAWRFPGFFV